MKVFIQNEAGSRIKHRHNEKTLEPKGETTVSRPYPLPYGFILNTNAEDGLNVDCFVITKRSLKTGEIVECEPIGLMEQIENDKQDHNVLAFIIGEREELDQQLKRALTDFVIHVFDHVPGNIIVVGEFLDREAALQHMAAHAEASSMVTHSSRS